MNIEKLAIVIPVYNEAEIISTVVQSWLDELDCIAAEQQSLQYKLFLYNDGSKDSTLNILNNLYKDFPDKINIFDEKNSGHGPTILKGYRRAANENYDWVFQVDSDNEMRPDMFRELWKQRKNFDFLTGQRAGRQQALSRQIVSRISRFTVRLFYGKSVWDVNTPYRLMKVSAFRNVFAQIPPETFAPNVIISGMAARENLRCLEIPVNQQDRQTGTVSIKKWKLLKAAVRSFSETIEFSLQYRKAFLLFWGIALFSLLAKLILASRGWNFDYESYNIVADIMRKGENVYAETARYNYGPIWFYVLYFLSSISGPFFRYAVPLFLGITDIGIAYILWKKFHSHIAALIFLLSPLCIHISGYHNQFDNVAVLLTLWAVTILSGSETPSTSSIIKSSVITGIALATKHIFIFFVFWYLFKPYNWKKKILLVGIPLAIFGASFVPYLYPWSSATPANIQKDVAFVQKQISVFKKNNMSFDEKQKEEIKNYSNGRFKAFIGFTNNVLRYKSYNNCIFHTYFTPGIIQKILPPFVLFVIGILFSGWIARKYSMFNTFIFYTACIVLFAPATTNQYLAIPAIFASINYLPLGFIYNIVPGIYLILNPIDSIPYMYIFCIGLLLAMYISFIYKEKRLKQ